MAKITLFPFKTKKGNDALIGSNADKTVTYFCADMSLASGDEVIVEDSDDAGFKFLKRVASGITIEIA